jgi:hypothetical protein
MNMGEQKTKWRRSSISLWIAGFALLASLASVFVSILFKGH